MSQEVPPLPAVDPDDPEHSGTPPDPAENLDADGNPIKPEVVEVGDANWKSLQEKYPGLSDEEIHAKVNASYWDQTKALGAASKREKEDALKIARLEGRVEGMGTPPDPADAPSPHPEVAELDTYISGLTDRETNVAKNQTDLLKTLSTTKDSVGEIKGEIKATKAQPDADEAAIGRLELKLDRAEDRLISIREKLEATVQSRKDIGWNRARAEKERHWIASMVEEGQTREDEERQQTDAQLESIPKVVDGHIAEAIGVSGMPADPALREDCRDFVRDKITIDLWKAGPTVPFSKVDTPKLVKAHIAKYMKSHKIAARAEFGAQSKAKAAVAGGQPPAAEVPGVVKKPTVVSGVGALSEGMLRGRRVLGKAGY